MPIYDFECKACGHSDGEYRKMGNFAPVEKCPKCDAFEYIKLVSTPHAPQLGYHTPIEMHSIACNSPEEIRQMQRAGIEISVDPKDELFGVPIARNRVDKLKALKVAGFIERT
jgi:putative FmdB family regulatory protein